MRTRFNEQLEQLNLELIKMGALCERAIFSALKIISNMERIGDHAVNIAQWVEYSITGTYGGGD